MILTGQHVIGSTLLPRFHPFIEPPQHGLDARLGQGRGSARVVQTERRHRFVGYSLKFEPDGQVLICSVRRSLQLIYTLDHPIVKLQQIGSTGLHGDAVFSSQSVRSFFYGLKGS